MLEGQGLQVPTSATEEELEEMVNVYWKARLSIISHQTAILAEQANIMAVTFKWAWIFPQYVLFFFPI